jgi:DNA-binding NtrC family response regulator
MPNSHPLPAEEDEVTEVGAARDDAATLRDPSMPDLRLIAVEGPQAGRSWLAAGRSRCSIGSDRTNRVVVEDRRVSRFHCEIAVEDGALRLRDLASTNGTTVDGVRVVHAFLRGGAVVRVGHTTLQLLLGREDRAAQLSGRHAFGELVGESGVMRLAFGALERAAASDSTVLLEGETGTGKDLAAEALHQLSTRQGGPFVVVDCGALPRELMESELFGHERGAFTGAVARRAGAFEAAHGGTIFLDEIGELPLELQPKLLRALERRAIRRVGANAYRSIDVRVIAATNRDLRELVHRGAFRADLYFRLAVVRVHLPPLRGRTHDLLPLARRLLDRMGAPAEEIARLLTPEVVQAWRRYPWPGNVRELRNHLERALVFGDPLAIAPPVDTAATPPSWRYADARQSALREFEREYISGLIERHRGRVADAAVEAGVDRVYLYRLMRRHDLRTRGH